MFTRAVILTRYFFTSPRHRFLALCICALAMFMGGVAAFGTTSDVTNPKVRLIDVVEQLGTVTPTEKPLERERQVLHREIRVRAGDSLSSIFSRLGIEHREALAYIESNLDTSVIFRQLVPGKLIAAGVSAEGEMEFLSFPLNGGYSSLEVLRTASGFASSIRPAQYELTTVLQTAVIRHSLFGAADEAGIPESVATRLTDIFGAEIDFHRDLRRGDTFSVIYEMASQKGKQVRFEKILAAEFVNDGKQHRAFLFPGNGSGSDYYDKAGRSIKRSFLRSPLEFSRITSGFSSKRFHPVLQEVRAHRGIDYGAPVGTQVKATGSGTVDFAGRQGAYGNLVIIRHAGDKTTAYGHLSGFATGVRRGARVSQGDIIGYVGTTGLATGPHLHYEFRVSGVHRNPLTVAASPTHALPDKSLQAFHTQTADLSEQLNAIRSMQLVMID